MKNDETDGMGISLQRIECSWCGQYLGAQVCAPEMAGITSHGMCPACSARQMASLQKTLVPGECLENVNIHRRCGLAHIDAGSPALLTGRKRQEKNEAASAPVYSSPEHVPTRVKGISAHGAQALSALEHLSRGPAASFTFMEGNA